MKKTALILMLLLSVTFLLFSCGQTPPSQPPANNDDPPKPPSQNQIFEYEKLEDGSYKITGVTSAYASEKELMIPLSYNGAAVTVIGAGAFKNSSVEKLVLTADTGIRLFENGCFEGAGSLKDLWIFYPTEEDILPPVSFAGVASDFTVHVPYGTNYNVGYYWSERGLTFEFFDPSGTELPDAPEEPTPENPPEQTKKTYRVMVGVDDGFEVTSQNPIDVEHGKTAVFDIKIDSSHAFSSVSVGSYDELTGKLTVENVTERLNIVFRVDALGYDTSVKYAYVFRGTDKDESSVRPSLINAGTLIRVTAGDHSMHFDGWSFGDYAKNGAQIVSKDRVFEFRLTPDVISDGALYVFPNYSDANVFYYDIQGGSVDTGSFNMSENAYYSAKVDTDGRVKVVLFEKYFGHTECASTFWDDGSFTKSGYILREYNTKPDGSGEPYSLGSKYFPKGENDEPPTLYCIWQKADEASDFEYRDYTYARPVPEKYAPEWIENGVIITKYLADSETVSVPEYINGKAVIAIAAGAFNGKTLRELVLPKTIQKIEDGAFVSCKSLTTLYYPDGIYSVSDKIFDTDTYKSFKNLYVNATIAPRFADQQYGAFATKFCRVLSGVDDKMIVFIAGSSTYQGLGSEYLEALLSKEYRVVNYGTTRTRTGLLYLEAMAHYTDSEDIIIYAPENCSLMFGEKLLDQRMTLDLEGTNNIYRYVDFSKYEGYFTALGEMNRDVRYTRLPTRYEAVCESKWSNEYGDYLNVNRENFGYSRYTDAYYITFNNRIKSMFEGTWSDVTNQEKNKDYTDPENITWTSMDRPELVALMNSVIDIAKSGGAKVYFGFAPSDADAVVEAARNPEWIAAYDKLISDLYNFDGNVGVAADYIYNHKYFYDCAFHVNDYGRTYRTYQLYLDLAEILGIKKVKEIYDVGTKFEGCKFEEGSDGTPLTKVDFLE